MIELLLFGLITGLVAGFFGVGGGMVLVPMLLHIDFTMKQAVSIAIMQMVFSSSFGSFLNSKTNKEILKDGIFLGVGGFIGGLLSGVIVPNTTNENLQYVFLGVVIFAIYRIGITPATSNKMSTQHSFIKLLIIGFIIGSIAMSIGVGGSVMLIPILAGYLHYDLKYASSLGLFFVLFSSSAGVISLSLSDNMLFYEGIIVGLASLLGVYIGIYLKNKAKLTTYKKYLLILYTIILVSTASKIL